MKSKVTILNTRCITFQGSETVYLQKQGSNREETTEIEKKQEGKREKRGKKQEKQGRSESRDERARTMIQNNFTLKRYIKHT